MTRICRAACGLPCPLSRIACRPSRLPWPLPPIFPPVLDDIFATSVSFVGRRAHGCRLRKCKSWGSCVEIVEPVHSVCTLACHLRRALQPQWLQKDVASSHRLNGNNPSTLACQHTASSLSFRLCPNWNQDNASMRVLHSPDRCRWETDRRRSVTVVAYQAGLIRCWQMPRCCLRLLMGPPRRITYTTADRLKSRPHQFVSTRRCKGLS